MQDTKVFSEIIKDSLVKLENEINEVIETLEKHLIENYEKNPFSMIHVIDETCFEIEGMIFGVFFTCHEIKSRYRHIEQYSEDTQMLNDRIDCLRKLKNGKCNEFREKYHFIPVRKRMRWDEEGNEPETEEG